MPVPSVLRAGATYVCSHALAWGQTDAGPNVSGRGQHMCAPMPSPGQTYVGPRSLFVCPGLGGSLTVASDLLPWP